MEDKKLDSSKQAVIGPSISIKGDVSGSQDILILGTVEGTVTLKENKVIVGTGATVNADIFGQTIQVEGRVNGNLTGGEKVVVHSSGHVNGNITAARLTLEDGARLKGQIDTDLAGADKPITKSLELSREATSKTDETSAAENGNSSLTKGKSGKKINTSADDNTPSVQ